MAYLRTVIKTFIFSGKDGSAFDVAKRKIARCISVHTISLISQFPEEQGNGNGRCWKWWPLEISPTVFAHFLLSHLVSDRMQERLHQARSLLKRERRAFQQKHMTRLDSNLM